MTEFLEELSQRFRSPVVGKFIFSWLITNWKIPYLTFFVSEEKLKTTKLEAVISIISEYEISPWINLFLIPLVATVLLIVAMPWLQNGVEMIRLHCNYLLEKYRERKNVEFESVAKQNAELNKLKQNAINELKHRILNSNISVNDIFIGRWKIEIIEEDKHTEFKGCELRSNKFFNDSGEVLSIQSIEKKNGNIHNFNAYASISIGSQSQWFTHSLHIDSGDLIRFYNNQNGKSIKLTREGIY